jgi:hypothetical protein
MPVQQQYIPTPQHQQSQEQGQRRGPGGGGGGGGRGSGRDDEFSAEDIAKVFRQLGKSSEILFSSATSFLITERSAHDLLTGSLEALANATMQGRLRHVVGQMLELAPTQRATAQKRIRPGVPAWTQLPVFTESESADIVMKIKDCLLPDPPK